MPCDCSHLEPKEHEVESRKVLTYLHEVGVEKRKPDYYGRVATVHEDTAKLCAWCQSHDVSKQSLELQIWWRDHQIADAKKARKRR